MEVHSSESLLGYFSIELESHECFTVNLHTQRLFLTYKMNFISSWAKTRLFFVSASRKKIVIDEYKERN